MLTADRVPPTLGMIIGPFHGLGLPGVETEMPRSLVQDYDEMDRWIIEGRPYREIVELYREKYDIELKPAMLANYRKRRGLPVRQVRSSLVPAFVEPVHRSKYILDMLRLVGRKRALEDAGLSDRDRTAIKPMSEREAERVGAFLENLATADAVVIYDPDSVDGFYYVPRLESDTDIVRVVEGPRGRPSGHH
jgi:hypothetical protein